jgi:hypothetical protein
MTATMVVACGFPGPRHHSLLSPLTAARQPGPRAELVDGGGFAVVASEDHRAGAAAATSTPRQQKLWAWTDHTGDLGQILSADQVLDNITLYWLTGTGASSARLYWESIAQVTDWFTTAASDSITVPAGCSIFPKEVPRPSRRWAQRRFTNIVHWNQPGRGGHFAAWEQPSLFIDEVRAVARRCSPPRR